MKHHSKKVPKLMTAAIILIFFAVAYTGYSATLDGVLVRPIIKFNNPEKLLTDKLSYRRGELVQVQLDYCKYRTVRGTATWQLVDGFSIAFASRDVSAAKGCRKIFVPVGNIPEFIPTSRVDKYHIEGITSYKLNGLNTVTYSLKSRSFKIE